MIMDIGNLKSSIGKEILNDGKTIEFSLSGDSMKSFIFPGDRIIIKKEYSDRIVTGDIVYCKTKETLILHRIVKKGKDSEGKGYIITKGDNNFFVDPQVLSNDIIGKAILIERSGKRINLERIDWRIRNYIIAKVSLTRAFIYRLRLFFRSRIK